MLRNTQRVQQTKGDDFVGINLGSNSLLYRKCEILYYKRSTVMHDSSQP